ncbi:MAG: hypothetical protein ACJA1A_000697, partial [Saprospiraceae bacterium]
NGGSTNTILNLDAGAYSVTVTDNNNCTFSDTYIVIQPDEIIVTSSDIDDLDCYDDASGSIQINPTGGSGSFSYTWSNGGSTNTISNLDAGAYSVTVTDNNNCTFTDTYIVLQPDEIIVTSSDIDDLDCYDDASGSIQINPTGGSGSFSYTWSNGGSTNTISNLDAGAYSVTVTDNNNCTFTDTYVVLQPDEIIVTSSDIDDLDCYDDASGSIQINAIGGTGSFSYAWTNGGNTNSISNLDAGVYSVTVTDENSCIFIDSYTVTQPDEINPNTVIIVDVECGSGATGSISLEMIDGNENYSYLWSNDEETSMISNLETGDYDVTITHVATECSAGFNYFVAQPGDLALESSTITDNTCSDGTSGSISLNISGGVGALIYEWSNTSAESSIDNLATGMYTVTISDENNCNLQLDFEVASPLPITADNSNIQDVLCHGDTSGIINLVLIGGISPYAVEWTYTNTENTETFVEWTYNVESSVSKYFAAGTIALKVEDENECVQELDVLTIQEPEIVSTNVLSATDVLCFGDTTGIINIEISGGISPYSVGWVIAPINGDPQYEKWVYNIDGIATKNLPAGVVSPKIVDANDCQVLQEPIEINQPEAIAIQTPIISDVLCFGDTTGVVNFDISGGTSPYSVEWTYNDPNGSESFIEWTYNNTSSASNNFGMGMVSTNILDENGCIFTLDQINIDQPDSLNTSALVVGNAICLDDTTGSIGFDISGGVPNYSIEWTYTPIGSSNPTIEWSQGITSSVDKTFGVGLVDSRIKDQNGCELLLPQQEIKSDTEITITTFDITQPKCGEDSTGVVNIAFDGGLAPYAVEWTYTPIGGTETFIEWTYNISDGLIQMFGAGVISGIIADNNGCTYTIEAFSLENADGVKILNIVESYEDELGSIELVLNMKSSGLKFEWQGPDGYESSMRDIDNLKKGIYSCVITDENGCQASTGDILVGPLSAEFEQSEIQVSFNTLIDQWLHIDSKTNTLAIGIRITTLDGKTVLLRNGVENPVSIDLSFLNTGLYMVTFSSERSRISHLVFKK